MEGLRFAADPKAADPDVQVVSDQELKQAEEEGKRASREAERQSKEARV
jgi:hypothetical protein